MKETLKGLQQAIESRGGVLFRGESGTGREELARAVHNATHGGFNGSVERLLREAMLGASDGPPFVVLDCSMGQGLERQLFGTPLMPPASGQAGLDCITTDSAIHQALGGTLFLRHITEIPGRLQRRLGAILRDGEVWVETKDGATAVAVVDVRPMAAIEPAAGDDRILPELHKRLAQTTIDVPGLRERREDIPALVRYTLTDICTTLGLTRKTASTQATALLAALPWRGNLPELRDLLRAMALRAPGRLIRLSDVLAHVRLDGAPAAVIADGPLKQARERFEREYVASVLEQYQGRMADAAKALGIQRTNLYRKVRQLAVDRRRPGRDSTASRHRDRWSGRKARNPALVSKQTQMYLADTPVAGIGQGCA